MARQALLRGPDLDSARRDADTGAYLDKPRSLGANPMARAFQPRRLPRGRTSTILRRAGGARRLT